jgi:hypothetical protein
VLRYIIGSIACACAAAASGCGGTDRSVLADGTYEYAFTSEEKSQLIARMTETEAEAMRGVGEVKSAFQFKNGRWKHFMLLDGNSPEWIGHSEGTFTTDGDQLILVQTTQERPPATETYTYQWDLEDGVLSLKVVDYVRDDDVPTDPDDIRLVDEHEFTMSG